jgi:6-phosphogluconolactonase (cycloisomerase 2 family)
MLTELKMNKVILTSALLLVGLASRAADNPGAGAIYTMDNSSVGNHLLVYDRSADGRLSSAGAIATGGLGSGVGLGSQGALARSDNGHWILACNAGSDEVSTFAVGNAGPVLTDKSSSGGKHPISVALHGNTVYVLNAGGQVGDVDSITGFSLVDGKLTSIPNSTHGLSADNTNPAQVGFSDDGTILIVTEKDSGVIDTFRLNETGGIADAKSFASAGQTPFGFDVRGDRLVVSEASGGAVDASAASSYQIEPDGSLELISASVPTTETSACWALITTNGRYAYTANTGSGTITGFAVNNVGQLLRLNDDGITAVTGGVGPADLAFSNGSRFLYVRNGNGSIAGFQVSGDGALTQVAHVPTVQSAVGLVGR